MRTSFVALALALSILSAEALGQPAKQVPDAPTSVASPRDHSADSPAMRRIVAAQSQLKTNPKNLQAANELAAALISRARETSNPAYLRDAESALTEALNLDPRDFQLRKTRVSLLLAGQKYSEARELATALNRQMPDDPALYGYLAQADIALGDYDAAEKSTQWMLNIRRNNVPGLLLGADLRSLWGDALGSLEFLHRALGETSPTDHEQMAWIANKIAVVQLESGKTSAAADTLARADQWFPNYRATLINLARVRRAQGRNADAVTLLDQAAQLHSDACLQYELLQAQRAAGMGGDSSRVVSDSASQSSDDTWCVVLAKSDSSNGAANALGIAERLISVRHDVWSLDAYAWALYANGSYTQAGEEMQKALAAGTESARLFDHAGHIARSLHRDADAVRYFERSLAANPQSEFAEDARDQLGKSDAAANGQSHSAPLPADSHSSASADPADSPGSFPLTLSSAPLSQAAPVFAPVPPDLLTPRPTATSRLIESARSHLAPNPHDAKAFAALGAAYLQRARETADVSDFESATQALQESLKLDASSFAASETIAALAEVCMGEHRFQDALDYAEKSLALGSGDLSPFAIMGDAYADMGDYGKAAQSYAHLTPEGATLAPREAYSRDSRLAYLQFVRGDTSGAIRLMKLSVAEGEESQIPTENLAWLHFELGEFLALAGNAADANAAYLTALAIHPGDYRALAGLARLRSNFGRNEDAILLYQKAIALVPMPVFIAALGDLYAEMGRKDDAEKQYRLVEFIGRLGEINQVLHNRDLAVFYADHGIKLPEAVALARKEFEVRHDIYSWDALAWALYKDGNTDEAYEASRKSLALGTRDALLQYHAGLIALSAGKRDEAIRHLNDAIAINPSFSLSFAESTRRTLASLANNNSTKASVNSNER
jgi:tetratricopeptide (TPR) repeat protein